MLDRSYTKGVLAVCEEDFKQYVSQFEGEELPEVLKRADISKYRYNGVCLTMLSWSVEDTDGGSTMGVEGDAELLRWFKGKPRRYILIGGNFDIYETADNVKPNMVEAFRRCFKRKYTVVLSNESDELGNCAEYLAMLEDFDQGLDMK